MNIEGIGWWVYMQGLFKSKLEMYVNKNNSFSSSMSTTNNNINSIFDTLFTCYNGSDLNYLFSKVVYEKQTINNISNILSNYSIVLTNVISSYKKQDERAKEQITNVISKF